MSVPTGGHDVWNSYKESRALGTEMLRCAQQDSLFKARPVVQWMATGCTVNTRQKKPVASPQVAQPKLTRGLG
ncbi:MAG TPA: hypothetical protein VIY29_04040 [Ktedonobacteraceae bacterium]